MTLSLRESSPAPAPVPPVERGRWPVLRRSLITGGMIGGFLSVAGAFGSGATPFLERTPFMVAISLVATFMGAAAFAVVGRSRRVAARWWLQGLLAALAMTLPITLVVWAALQLVARPPPPLAGLPAFVPTALATSVFFCLFAAHQRRHRLQREAAVAAGTLREPTPVRFLDRLPPKLRGAELWAVEAEDHYLRLHTSKGQDLLLLRLSDAIGELAGLEGAQTHRSWWVARAAIADVRRGDGRAVLTLKDGAEVPVSRSHARRLRDRGWL